MDAFEYNSLTGHGKNRELLMKLLKEGSCNGSYIFSGADALGKKMTALWFAALVNCGQPHPPCGRCVSCRKISRGIHPDVRLIQKAPDKTVITIDQIRDAIISEADYKPFEGRYRVFIIDDAHLLNEQAQNSLLKTLEEPGESMIFVLVTSRISELLPTVVSRCTELRFFPLSVEDLKQVLSYSHVQPDSEKLRLLTDLASGAPGRAIMLAEDEGFWEMRREIFGVLEKLPDGSLGDILNFSDRFRIARSDVQGLEEMFGILLSWFRDMQFIILSMDEKTLINQDFAGNIRRIAGCFNLEDIVQIQDLILEIRKLVFENNLNLKMGIQRLLIRIRNFGTVKI